MFCATIAALTCAIGASAVAVAPRSEPDGSFVIQDVTSGLYIVSYAAVPALIPTVTNASEATVFQLGDVYDGGLFQFLRNYELNTVVTSDTAVLESARSTISTDEEFTLEPTTGGISIQAKSNNLYVTTTSAGLVNSAASATAGSAYAFVSAAAPVTAVGYAAGEAWLKDSSSGLYVVSNSSGLFASATSTSAATIFQLSPGGSYSSIQSLSNDLYVTADSSGNYALVASKSTASTWEEFEFFYIGLSTGYAIKANSNGLYVKTTSTGLFNSAYSQASASLFQIVNANPGRV